MRTLKKTLPRHSPPAGDELWSRQKPIDIVKKYGATEIVSYKDSDTVEQILRAIDGKGFDKIEDGRSGAGIYRGTEGDQASISSEQEQFDTYGCIFLTSTFFLPAPKY